MEETNSLGFKNLDPNKKPTLKKSESSGNIGLSLPSALTTNQSSKSKLLKISLSILLCFVGQVYFPIFLVGFMLLLFQIHRLKVSSMFAGVGNNKLIPLRLTLILVAVILVIIKIIVFTILGV